MSSYILESIRERLNQLNLNLEARKIVALGILKGELRMAQSNVDRDEINILIDQVNAGVTDF